MTVLDLQVAAARCHAALRGQQDPQRHGGESSAPLEAEREEFARSKKKLKSDLKKCTAFVKKIKGGTYPAPKELESPNHPLRTLNLSRYVEEMALVLLELQSNVKQAGVPGMVAICMEMHRWYATFAKALVPTLLSCVYGSNKGDNRNGGRLRLPHCVYFRLLMEFVTAGVCPCVHRKSVERGTICT